MAKIVIAGRSDCARYAKAEAVADRLRVSLPDFKIHKIVVNGNEWDDWLAKVCKKNNWKHERSPIIWRELVDRGGKGLLIGDENHFQEYAKAFYNIEKDAKTTLLKNIATENVKFKQAADAEVKDKRQKYKPYTVCLTNASSPLAYHLVPLISQGVFGERTDLEFRLADEHEPLESLEGLRMEIEDLAVSQIREVNAYNKVDETVFRKAHMIILLDVVEAEEGESQRSYLQRVAEFYRSRAKLIGATCTRSTRVVLAAISSSTPLNFILNVMREALKGSPFSIYNLVGIPRLFENEARQLLAEKLGVLPAKVRDVVLWGNIAAQFYMDVRFAKVFEYPGAIRGPKWYGRSVSELIWDKRWLNKQVHAALVKRDQEVRSKFTFRPSIALANALAGCLRDWLNGMPENSTISNLVVYSEGAYGLPADTFFCYPVRFSPPGYWSLFDDLQVTPEVRTKLDAAIQSIKSEFDTAFGPELPPIEPEPVVEPPPEKQDDQVADSKLSQITEESGSFSRVSAKPDAITEQPQAGEVEDNNDADETEAPDDAVTEQTDEEANDD